MRFDGSGEAAKPTVIAVTERLPAFGETVWVVTKDFRCRGYLDGNYAWHILGTTHELKDVLGWYPSEANSG